MRKRKEFTPTDVKNLKPKPKRYEVWEERGAGLGIRVSPLGTKTWVYVYRAGGKPRFMTLGRFPETSVEKAHELHAKHRHDVAQGADPGAAKIRQTQAERGAPTVATVVEEYIERYAAPRKRSWKDDARILRREALPAWGSRKAKDVTRRDVLELLDGIVTRGTPIMANRCFAVLRKMFAWAVSRDLVPASPCVGIERPAEEQQRDRVLTPSELSTLWEALGSLPATDRVPQVLRLIIATAQRPGEVLGATWQEFDFDSGWWTIPAERSKNGLAHRVPLTRTSRRILQDARLVLTSYELVFPSPRGGALDRCAPSHWTRRNAPALELAPFTPHDLRRSAASGMTALGFPRLVVGRILNHAERGVTAVYDRHSYDREKLEALTAWSDRLEQLGKKRKERRA